MFKSRFFIKMFKTKLAGLYGVAMILGCNPPASTPSVSEANQANQIKKVLITMQEDSLTTNSLEIATLGGGCFWCIEPIFDDLKGVKKVVSGYTGGAKENPTYKEVCYGNTGHAEVIDVYFDPQIISFDDILRIFFHVHDPTTLNRQGNDIGTQYRSSIFYHSETQKQSAERIIEEIEKSKLWDSKIVTELTTFARFYSAENYHQQYYKLNGHAPYCQYIIAPKMSKFRKEYKDKLKT